MAFWDIFSGNPGRNTAIWGAQNQQAGAGQQLGYIDQGQTAAQKQLTRSHNLSLEGLRQTNRTARADVTGQYGLGLDALTGSRDSALDVYNRNPAILQGAADRSDAFYAPLGEEANRGFSAYGDAAGVNGAAGQDRARSNFRAGPGYQFTVDEATNAAVRAANAAGMTASGNTLDSVTRLGANLADKEFDDYVARLNPYLQLAPSIAGSRAGIQTQLGKDLAANNVGIAGIHTGYGKDAAALRMGEGNTLASLATGLGTNLTNVRQAYGTNMANIATGAAQNRSNIAGANTAALTNLGTAGMGAGQQANANTWNAGMQVANLVADTAGKFKNPFG
ncbi:MAG: hypothetical protein ABWY64_11795 [Tardiphaga sp.]